MLSSKFISSTFLLANSLSFLKDRNYHPKAECAGQQTGAEKGAQDLDQIFAAHDTGMPPDPEEIQEMLMKAQGKTIRKPPSFQRLMMSLKMLTMVEPLDGIKFDLMAPLSQRFQIGGSWNFSNTKSNKFELHTVLSSLSSNPMMGDEMSFVQTKSDSTGKIEFSGQLNLGTNLFARTEGFFMDADVQKSHLQFELMKEFTDSHIAYKFGGGSHIVSFMQTLNPRLIAGFEMYYIVSN